MASRSDLTAVRNTAMTPLRPKDKEHFSIRMSPYKFAERAYAVVEFYAKCDAVEQIQLLWDLDDYTDQENKEVEEVMGKIGNGKVVLDKRRGTTLHDKFDLKVAPPTYGMLMVEDEIVFACDALKMGFYRWTRHPERLVGYEPRLHKENAFQWEYASYTDAMSANRYSMVRLSSTFIHVDYLKLYINYLPRSMYDAIVDSKKCEGIAMSLFVSSLTGGRPPLLADYWATQSKVVLYSPNGSRSDTRKVTLHACVDTFVTELELRYKHMKIRDAHLFHGIFSFGSKLKEDMEEGDYTIPDMNEKEKNIRKKVSHWNSDNFKDKVGGLKKNLKAFMTKRGLVKDTDPWKKKYGFSKKLSKKKRN
uniref:Glycosyl transferase 64 domain-containing protein n=1 Tax=Corethron hystrix TaxID=216773 RepID=A0A7S1BQV8_9STRA